MKTAYRRATKVVRPRQHRHEILQGNFTHFPKRQRLYLLPSWRLAAGSLRPSCVPGELSPSDDACTVRNGRDEGDLLALPFSWTKTVFDTTVENLLASSYSY